MARIERFEDIVAWQKAMELSNLIYAVTNTGTFSRDFSLKDQIRKSAISVVSNIAEGFERESNNQFIYFLVIAKGSAGELRTQILIAKNQNYLSEEQFIEIYQKVLEVSKIISGFIVYLRGLKQKKVLN